MAIKMVRQPSDTPNINNVDDFIPFRYAYGDQSGYVIGKGAELSNTIIGNTFRINSGRVVIQGVECDIDANGYDIVVDNISSTRYHSIYLEVNLALMTIEIKETSDSAVYPTIDAGDDLTHNSSGTARLLLYNIQSKSGVISDVTKVVKEVKYAKEYIKTVKVDNSVNSDYAIKNYDNSYSGFSKDANDKLSTDDKIVPTKVVLYEGSASFSVTFNDGYKLKIGDVIEVHLSNINILNPNFDNTSVIKKYKISSVDTSSFADIVFPREDFINFIDADRMVIQSFELVSYNKTGLVTYYSTKGNRKEVTISNGTISVTEYDGEEYSPKITAVYKIIE